MCSVHLTSRLVTSNSWPNVKFVVWVLHLLTRCFDQKGNSSVFCYHCVKYRNFTNAPGLEYLWKHTVSSEFQALGQKLCGKCVFLQNFHTGKLGENSVFYAM